MVSWWWLENSIRLFMRSWAGNSWPGFIQQNNLVSLFYSLLMISELKNALFFSAFPEPQLELLPLQQVLHFLPLGDAPCEHWGHSYIQGQNWATQNVVGVLAKHKHARKATCQRGGRHKHSNSNVNYSYPNYLFRGFAAAKSSSQCLFRYKLAQ